MTHRDVLLLVPRFCSCKTGLIGWQLHLLWRFNFRGAHIVYKKVLLRERNRHTARHVAALSPDGEYPHPVPTGGLRPSCLDRGGSPIQSQQGGGFPRGTLCLEGWGTPSRKDGYAPVRKNGGTPPPSGRMGYPLPIGKDGGTPQSGRMGVPPQLERMGYPPSPIRT